MSLIRGIQNAAETNRSAKQKDSQTENRPMGAREEGQGAGWMGSSGLRMQTVAFRMDKHEGLSAARGTVPRIL